MYDDTIDNIVGVVYAKEFHTRLFNHESFAVRDIVRPVKYVPETMSMDELFNDFQKTKIHMAVVLDSHGGTLGIVTLEDVLEALVGEIWDESDDILHDIVERNDGTWVVLGDANIFDVMEKIGYEFDPEDYEDYSVMGYVLYKLNRAPIEGDVISYEDIDIRVDVVQDRMAVECTFTRVVRVKEDHSEETSED